MRLRSILATGAGVGSTLLVGGAVLGRHHHPQRVLRSDARALQGLQRRLRRALEGQDRRDVTIEQSHGGSGKQARAVIDGLDADVVTLALAGDIDAIAKTAGKIPADWQTRLPQQLHALHLDHRLPGPQGQSQGHQGLGRSGQGRRPGDHAEPEDLGRRALELSRRLGLCRQDTTAATKPRPRTSSPSSISNVPVLDTGARGSTMTFAQKRASATCCSPGRTRPTWRSTNSAPTSSRSSFRSISILAEPPVAVVDGNVDAKGTRKVAEAYLELPLLAGRQKIIAKNHYRPSNPTAADPEDSRKLSRT